MLGLATNQVLSVFFFEDWVSEFVRQAKWMFLVLYGS